MEYKLTYEQFQQGLERGELLGLKCNTCNSVTFPPMVRCRECNSTDLEVTQMSGKGTIRTFTVIRVAPEGMTPPYVVAMAETDEGAWVMGNLVGIDPDDAHMGLMGKKVSLGSHLVKGDTYSGGDSRVITFSLV
ncbi:MAG: Zn-ribbon domain-containing OB-fold protein [Deltaproteobacteria bacterium]|nr:Zn-ribbon domain-containing OB-fold protein [Deltaproteobacteria bacterium]MBW2047032.1 Zn-ribbon domain-containing OB-fold protein [Deltaproteobacteria bacterium]MBW2110064.1 Zn-ribbon domain-containing OB-fold protein [Deltaproteobacteria bacterium]MBW2351658.1 Zn-ribbon domain-containing OB-fold protein [Deltaproteobacteria bacterium]HDZ89480.1 Zn-ribbon domain-containing OB-fold protein [Deltaproteobacteria bacterium]